MPQGSIKHVVIVGAGPAGCSAALEAATLGLKVTLVDEHPQSAAAMSLDAPYFYGARLVPELYNPRAMAEQVLTANEPLLECLDAGVDVLTGTVAWGVFRPGPTSRQCETLRIGLADAEKSWCREVDQLILATGGRDLVLSFPGWELPGVLGVKAANMLLAGYRALGGRTLVILGSGNAALAFARQALDHELTVVAIVEPTQQVQGDEAAAASLRHAGVPFLLGHTIAGASGRQQVEAARLVRLDTDGTPRGEATTLPCDTICMAYGVVPNVELAALAGCTLAFDGNRSGWVPVTDADMASDVEGIHVIGEAAGVCEAMHIDDTIAMAQGRRAARAIARRGGLANAASEALDTTLPACRAVYPPDAWIASLVATGGMDVTVCQCEEVTRAELLQLSPPRYLDAAHASPDGAITTAVADGTLSQDLVKRMTRCGMGHCQGRRCREHAALLLAQATGLSLSSVVPGSYRVPVRPMPLGVLQAHDEDPALRMRWPSWLHPVDGPPTGL